MKHLPIILGIAVAAGLVYWFFFRTPALPGYVPQIPGGSGNTTPNLNPTLNIQTNSTQTTQFTGNAGVIGGGGGGPQGGLIVHR